jgi:hypothetical protein
VTNTKSYEFLKKLYRFLGNQRNQGVYVIQFFNAAGSNYFHLSENRQHRTNTYLETERRYALNKSLSPEIKDSFPNPIYLDNLTSFIAHNMKQGSLVQCMEQFGVPSDAEQDLEKFSRSLAIQFSQFVNRDVDDVHNSVWEIYQALLKGNEITQEDLRGPRYKGDDVYVDARNRKHEADCYEIIHHEWKIQNRGSIPWRNRKLVMVNQADIHPRPVKKVIPLQDIEPNEFINIATDIDARGFEGDFECKWEMQDADGENCFPNKRWDFNIRIRVTFNATTGGEQRG